MVGLSPNNSRLARHHVLPWQCEAGCARSAWKAPKRSQCQAACASTCVVPEAPDATGIEYDGRALRQAVIAESGAGNNNFLAHHAEAMRFAQLLEARTAEVIREGGDVKAAADSFFTEVVAPAIKTEIGRKIKFLRSKGQTPKGRMQLLQRGFIQPGMEHEKLLGLESANCLPAEEIDKRWKQTGTVFETHMRNNVGAALFNSVRRDASLPASVAKSAECEALFQRAAGRAFLADLADIGVGHLDDFDEPHAVQSLHVWLLEEYEGGELFSSVNSTCNIGSFHASLEFNIRGNEFTWVTPRSMPADAGRVLTKLLGVAAEVESAFRFPLRLWGGLKVGVYPAGGPMYKRHLDKYDYEEANFRSLTCLLYTNPDWERAGGELRVCLPGDTSAAANYSPTARTVDFQPIANRLVCFWSRTVVHEVLASHKGAPPRFAISLWAQSGGSWEAHGFKPNPL